MISPSVITRALTQAEAETLIGWAAQEGWNPGRSDACLFHDYDPEGFIGCFVDGRMAAGISAIRYGDDYGFIGLYICHPEMRGKGYGQRVWDAAMARLDGRTIGLDGVPEQQANYAKMGFELAYRTWRWSGQYKPNGSLNRSISDVSDELSYDVIAFDRQFFPAPRDGFISEWITPPHICKTVLRDGKVSAYGVLRKCRDGFKIGPLFAQTGKDAQAIFEGLAEAAAGDFIHIDVPETAMAISGFLLNAGFTKGFVTARMYRGTSPAAVCTGIYGITTLELG